LDPVRPFLKFNGATPFGVVGSSKLEKVIYAFYPY